MSTIEQSPARGRAGIALLLPAFSLETISRMFSVWRNRRVVLRMREFDDAQLNDIGLKRHDVEMALTQSTHLDPTLHLIRARQTRMRGIRMR